MHLKSWTWASRELEALLRPTNRVRMAFQTLLWLLNMCPLWIAFDAVFPLFLAWIVVFLWCQFPIVYVPAHSFCIVANCAVECQSVNRNDLTFCHFLAWNQDFIMLGKVFHLRVKKQNSYCDSVSHNSDFLTSSGSGLAALFLTAVWFKRQYLVILLI